MSDAGCWKRFAAAFIDGIITLIGSLVIGVMFAVMLVIGFLALSLNFYQLISDWNVKR